MPLPDALRPFNRAVTNKVLGLLGGKVRPFATVIHRGRSSGRTYRTTVLAFEGHGAVAIALDYGRDVDWARNLLAAGAGTVELGGESIAVVRPRVVGRDEGDRFMPPPVLRALRALDVEEYLLADRA